MARGTDCKLMPVFKIVDGKGQRAQRMTYPACLEFMPYAEPIGDLGIEH